MNKKSTVVLMALIVLIVSAGAAFAFTAPAATDFFYDIYDIGVNRMLKGPIGFVGGIIAMVAAAILAVRQMILPAAGTVLAGIFLLKADSLVTSLGALIL
jgi:hypothetical protein